MYGNKCEKRKEGAGNEDQIRREKDLINSWAKRPNKMVSFVSWSFWAVPPHAEL
jgi:hypothetical protein